MTVLYTDLEEKSIPAFIPGPALVLAPQTTGQGQTAGQQVQQGQQGQVPTSQRGSFQMSIPGL